jgi:hypothetical protein
MEMQAPPRWPWPMGTDDDWRRKRLNAVLELTSGGLVRPRAVHSRSRRPPPNVQCPPVLAARPQYYQRDNDPRVRASLADPHAARRKLTAGFAD